MVCGQGGRRLPAQHQAPCPPLRLESSRRAGRMAAPWPEGHGEGCRYQCEKDRHAECFHEGVPFPAVPRLHLTCEPGNRRGTVRTCVRQTLALPIEWSRESPKRHAKITETHQQQATRPLAATGRQPANAPVWGGDRARPRLLSRALSAAYGQPLARFYLAHSSWGMGRRWAILEVTDSQQIGAHFGGLRPHSGPAGGRVSPCVCRAHSAGQR